MSVISDFRDRFVKLENDVKSFFGGEKAAFESRIKVLEDKFAEFESVFEEKKTDEPTQ